MRLGLGALPPGQNFTVVLTACTPTYLYILLSGSGHSLIPSNLHEWKGKEEKVVSRAWVGLPPQREGGDVITRSRTVMALAQPQRLVDDRFLHRKDRWKTHGDARNRHEQRPWLPLQYQQKSRWTIRTTITFSSVANQRPSFL